MGTGSRLSIALLVAAACGSPEPAPEFQVVARDLPGALLSVWGTSTTDVYVVGGDANDGRGPTVMHFDGVTWERLDTGEVGNLWWVYGFAGGPVYMGGDGGMILRYDGGAFTRMPTPTADTVFGIWGASPDDVWAVGGAPGGSSGGFAWRLQGDTWVVAPGFPAEITANAAIWKMYGRSANDAWMVGTKQSVRWDGSSLTTVSTGVGESLFTVHADTEGFVAVGGFGTGLVVEHDGTSWRNTSPAGASAFIGVCLTPEGEGYVVGQFGAVFRRDGSEWIEEDLGFNVDESFHSVWIDPANGVWLAGGEVLTLPVTDGILLYRGTQDVPPFE